jgi:hypothetical protein
MSDQTTPQMPPIPEMPPPPSATAPTAGVPGAPAGDAWSSSPPPRRRRPTGFIVGAVVVVLALVGGLVAFNALGGEDSGANAQPLALTFVEGDATTYTMHMTMTGEMDAGELLGGVQALDMDVTQVVTWEVASVDDEGVATITVTIEEMSGTVNGMELPSDSATMEPMEIQIAPDGRILSAGGMSFAGADLTGGASFPGMGQMTPMLPDEPVEPGDTWEEEFSQDVPFGEGTIEYTSTSTLERYEDVDGVNAAVITTEYTVPMDLTFDFGELLDSMGGAEGLTGSTLLADAQMTLGGEGSFTQTAWVDAEAGEMLKMTSSGAFDMTIGYTGVEMLDGMEIDFTGDFTQDLKIG